MKTKTGTALMAGKTVALLALTLPLLAGCLGTRTTETPAPGSSSAATPSGSASPIAATGAPLGTVKVGDKAVCTVCARGGHTSEPEEVKATIDYKGKTYAFCSEAEKAEFISSPAKYADAAP